MHFFRNQPIRRQILASTCVLFLPFAIAVAWSSSRARLEREGELREQAGAVAITAAAYLNQSLANFDAVATTLARHPAVQALDSEGSGVVFEDILKEQPLLLNIVLTDTAGRIRGTGLKARTDRGPVVENPYVQQVVKTGKPVVSDLTSGAVSNKPTVILGYPVYDDRQSIVGTLGLGVNLARLQSVFSSIPLPDGSVITVSDSTSRVLARSRDPERFIGNVADPRAVPPESVAPSQVRVGLDGIPRFYGNATIARGPWVLSVGIPTHVAVERVTPLWRRNSAIIATAVVTLIIASLVLAARISSGLNGLRQAAQRIAAGDLSPPPRQKSSTKEFAELQDAFIIMAANLREAQHALDRQVEEERKMREALQSLQRQVVRQERLAAVGLLVSGVAHEVNNPLQAILGTAELLEKQSGLSREALDEITFMKTQSGRAREIIRNLSRFSSQQSGPPSLVDLRDVVAEVVQLRQSDLANSSIVLDVVSSSSRQVYANFTELEQVTLNFVINAQQSIEGAGRSKGRILIRISDTSRRVRLEVQDDGPGVTATDEPKLFQPFFTTKPVGKGTGLGLSVSYGIIESYGGAIGYTGNSWGGATFFFELPAADALSGIQIDDGTPVLHRSVPSKV